MSSPDDLSATEVESLTYEQALSELEGIVTALESGDHTLEAALAQYERGQVLARHCARLLDQAELKIKSLSGEVWVDLDRAENKE
jgi:exodeoxyribonuclease VII small subunit